MDVYPIFLTDLRSRRCVVIGGNSEAERKVEGLLAAKASVTVINETLTHKLSDWADQQRFTWLPRACRPGDLQGAWLAIAAVRDNALAARLKDEAERYGVLLNVADDAPHSNFVHGAVMRRGPLAVAVSTSGLSNCSPETTCESLSVIARAGSVTAKRVGSFGQPPESSIITLRPGGSAKPRSVADAALTARWTCFESSSAYCSSSCSRPTANSVRAPPLT